MILVKRFGMEKNTCIGSILFVPDVFLEHTNAAADMEVGRLFTKCNHFCKHFSELTLSL